MSYKLKKNKFTFKIYLIIKRLIDFLLALIGLVLLIPIFLIVSLLIKIDSRGPVIFKQKRFGIYKQPFYIYKFRTMRVEAPKSESTNNFVDSNKYITQIGNILRKTSIDELPQLFNILLGQMSIVGPRPVILNEVDLIEARDKYFANDVKPGITGWAQINGRDKLYTSEKAKLDGYYVERMGILMDLKCILLTIGYVFKGKDIVEGGEKKYSRH